MVKVHAMIKQWRKSELKITTIVFVGDPDVTR